MSHLGAMLHQWNRNRIGVLFLLPSILLVVAVTFAPIAYAIWVSLHQTFYLNLTKFIGLQNYVAFLQDPTGRDNILKSFTYTFGSLALALPIGMGLALLLNRPMRFRVFIRSILITPWIVSLVVTALLWAWLLNSEYGPVNFLIRLWLGAPFDFLGQPVPAMLTLILANVWQSYPYPMVLLLAALQTVPNELYEAAKVDGASAWQRYWKVTLPLIRNTLLITTIMLSLQYFNMVTLVFVLTGGGPVRATDVLSLRVYREAFAFNHLGLASAIAILIFIFNIVFSLLYIRVLRAESHC